MRPSLLCAIGGLCVAALVPAPARALTVTLAECAEGADFIRNAALARDNGMAGPAFLERLEGDLAAIRSFRPELRWFARDADDESLLRVGATSVFATPQAADEHQRAFLAHCRATVTAAAGQPPRVAAASAED